MQIVRIRTPEEHVGRETQLRITFHHFKLSDVSRVLGRKEIRKDRGRVCEYDEPEGSLWRKVWGMDVRVSHMRGVEQDLELRA